MIILKRIKNIFFPHDGNKIIRIDKSSRKQKVILELEIVRGKHVSAQISSLVSYSLKDDCHNIQGIKYYQENLYLFLSSFYIIKFDLNTKKFVQVAKDADLGYFCKNDPYYINGNSTMS